MPASSLREVTIGVAEMDARARQFEMGCGLSVGASGVLAPTTMRRLFDNREELRACVLGPPDAAGSPGIRLVEVGDSSLPREYGPSAAGALGLTFTTPDVSLARARLEELGLRFLIPALRTAPTEAPRGDRALPAEGDVVFGRSLDGDLIGFSESAGGAIGGDAQSLGPHSSLLEILVVVTNLDACLHFMNDVLGHETHQPDPGRGVLLSSGLGLSAAPPPRLAASHCPGRPFGRTLFMEFEKKREPMAQSPALARGLCRLRYDTSDLDATLGRVPGGGGSLVRGPASIDDPLLGPGLVALVRAPFGMLIELWQNDGA